mgnify:CR=1 FL=1
MAKDLRSPGLPRRPKPLRGKDLGRFAATTHTTLKQKIEVKFLLRDPLDVAGLSGVEDFSPFHDLRPLVAVGVGGVEDNANGASNFSFNFLHNKNS